MPALPPDGEGLAWIAAQGTAKLPLASGIHGASIVAASLGHQQALAHLRVSVQRLAEHAAWPADTCSQPHKCRVFLSECCEACQLRLDQGGHYGDVLKAAAKENRVAAVQWLRALCHGSLAPFESSAMNTAAAHGNLAMMTLLQSGPNPAHWGCYDVIAAAPHLTCFNYLIALDPSCHWLNGLNFIFEDLARNGHLDALISLHAHTGHPSSGWLETVMVTATKHGHLPILQWLRSLYPEAPWPCILCIIAADKGHLDILQWLRNQEPPAPYDRLCSAAAAGRGHLTVLQWLSTQDPPCPMDSECTTAAARQGHLDVLKWLRLQGCAWDADCAVEAAAAGDLIMLQWLHSEGCEWDQYCTYQAAEAGNLRMLEWLCTHGCDIHPHCAAVAASKGHLPVLQYLRSLGLSFEWSLYYRAAAGGQPTILQWLRRTVVPTPERLPETFAMSDHLYHAPAPLLMFLEDIGAPIPACLSKQLEFARRKFCVFHGLVRWSRRAVHDPSKGIERAFIQNAADNAGEHLLIRLSMLPQELINKISAMAGLQHDLL